MANLEVIDADGHITESDAQLKKYMPEKYVKRVSSLTPGDSWDRSLSGKLGSRAGDAKSWLDAMDRGKVSTAVLYPTNGLSVGWIREPDVAVQYAQAWNNFCSEEFQKVSPRLEMRRLGIVSRCPRGGQRAAPGGAGTKTGRFDAPRRRPAPTAGSRKLLAHL